MWKHNNLDYTDTITCFKEECLRAWVPEEQSGGVLCMGYHRDTDTEGITKKYTLSDCDFDWVIDFD